MPITRKTLSFAFISFFFFCIPIYGSVEDKRLCLALMCHLEDRLDYLAHKNGLRGCSQTSNTSAVWEHPLNEPQEEFSFERDLEPLWKNISCPNGIYEQFLQPAKILIEEGDQNLALGNIELAHQYFCESSLYLRECFFIANSRKAKHVAINDDAANATIDETILKRIRPFLMPQDHFLKPSLDDIFSASRATLNASTFAQAGFCILFSQFRSCMQVASHPKLPGYLVKVQFDSELRAKEGVPCWEWLARRCEVAQTIRKLIKRNKIKNFIVPKKCIYLLPKDSAIPEDPFYQKKIAILVVERMPLVSAEKNKEAWKTQITKKHLSELYELLVHLPGITVRPDNIAFTEDQKLAFIDTEYVGIHPRYKTILPYLSEEMQNYWSKLVKNGGR